MVKLYEKVNMSPSFCNLSAKRRRDQAEIIENDPGALTFIPKQPHSLGTSFLLYYI